MIRKKIMLSLVLLTAGCVQTAQRDEESRQIAGTIIAMEEMALDRWGKGDPSGFLEISAPDIVYFDPSLDKRLDGLSALKDLYEGIRGKLSVDRYEMINPRVQLCGDCAILTFNYVGYSGGKTYRWNCTEVYRHQNDRWEIIQTHWSFTKPPK